MKSYKVFYLLFVCALSLYACKSESATVEQKVENEKVAAPKMSDEKKKGKGNRKGQLPAKTFRINNFEVNGVKAGMRIADLQHVLVRGKIRTGEGTLEVYRIRDDKGGPMGYVVPRIGNSDLVGDITLDSKKVLTSHEIRVGDDYFKLKEAVKDIRINGSEIEGRVYASTGRVLYRLDIVNFNQELDKSKIPDDTKVTEIIIKDLKP